MTDTTKDTENSVAVPPALAKPALPTATKERTDIPPLPKYVEETLEARGARLPIGFPGETGALNRAFDSRNWTTRLEKEVNKKHKGEKGAAKHVTNLLAVLLSNINGKTWDDEVELKTRKELVSNMYAADVFFMYCWLRLEALGEDLKMKIECPVCEKSFPWVADLNTLDVRSIADAKDLIWEYPVLKPFELRGVKVEKLRIGVQRWSGVELLTAHFVEEGWLKAMTVASHIVGINNEADLTTVAAHELDDLHKKDLEWLVSEIDARYVGPKMSLELECQYDDCKSKIVQMINWRYGDFFSVSSR